MNKTIQRFLAISKNCGRQYNVEKLSIDQRNTLERFAIAYEVITDYCNVDLEIRDDIVNTCFDVINDDSIIWE